MLRRLTLPLPLAVLAASLAAAQPVPGLLHTSEEQRRLYLATARIWEERAVPTPDEIRLGPVGRSPLRDLPLSAAGELACTYVKGGAGSPGRTAKFTCRTGDGRMLRVKYYDGNPKSGNREVFAEVVATRLFWALGFDADPLFPVTVDCTDCPADPNAGRGPRAARRYVSVVEAMYEGTIIASDVDTNQGWGFAELAAAIAGLPAGPLHERQRTHFDALALLSIVVQHGDRKPPQQRLVCRGPLDLAAGDIHAEDDDGGFHLPVLFEREGRRACASTGITVQDLGATFGGAGLTTPATSKVHLASWARHPVFAAALARPNAAPAVCRGHISVSGTAGADAGGDLPISEGGRRFLHERLARLGPDHLRALFEVARVEALGEAQEYRDPRTKQVRTGIDGWVAAFEHKVAEIGGRTCAP